MIKKCYIMRHGQTLFNVQGRIQGACDSPLTELGIEQAKTAKDHFDQLGLSFKTIYSSPQERACDTAEIASDRTDIIRLKGLKEWNFGTFEGHPEYLNPRLHKEDGSGYRDYFVAYGGESNVQVYERMDKTIREIMTKETEDNINLFVSHGASISQFYRHKTLNPPILDKGMPNCAILELTYDGNDFQVQSVYNPYNHDYVFQRKK
ncbi:histidine phosphatase family protein [Streptococcus hongkongensis]|nr:phosphoglycerate mutase [Streptococcus uberis]